MAVLLISEDRVKETSSISDNIAPKFLQSSIREAQDQGFKAIVGEALFRKLCGLVQTGQIKDDENVHYKELLSEAQYYLAYRAIVELCMKVSYKVGNFGVAKSNDENLQVATFEEIVSQREYYQAKADSYCRDLQKWILHNKGWYPELTQVHCDEMEANLYSAASCGLFLGGARGKIVGPCKGRY